MSWQQTNVVEQGLPGHRAQDARTQALLGLLARSGLFFLGFGVMVPKWTSFGPTRVPPWMIVAVGVAALGWTQRALASRVLKRYMLAAGSVCAWLLVSSVAAWAGLPLYRWRYVTLHLLFTVPGIALLLRRRHHRMAIVSGFAIGATSVALVSISRLLRGLGFFDVLPVGSPSYPQILDVNRNRMVTLVLVALSFVAAGSLPRALRMLRIPVIALLATFIVLSGSRGGLVGVVVLGLVLALVQGSQIGRARVLYAAALVATVSLALIQGVGGQARVSLDRFGEAISGSESEADEVRRLLLRKAWNIALDHPLFGTGLGTFSGTDDAVLTTATTRHVRDQTSFQADHNAFAGLMAEAGFPALITFSAFVALLFRMGFKHRAQRAVRAATCAFSMVVFALFFGLTYSDPISYFTFAMLLGAILDSESRSVEPMVISEE